MSDNEARKSKIEEDEEDRTKDKVRELTRNKNLLYVRAGSATTTIEGKVYPRYKLDKNGLPLKYSTKAFKKRIDSDIQVFQEAIYVIQRITEGFALYKAGVDPDDNPRSLQPNKIFTVDDVKVEINRHTVTRITKYLAARHGELARIYNTTATGTGHSKPKKASIRVFDKEWVDFFRSAATARLFGTKKGKPATSETDEEDLLFPSTKDGQKKHMPYIFGYGEGFKDLCVVRNGFLQSFMYYFLYINGCKNEGTKDYVRTEVNGKSVKITGTTYNLPTSFTKKLPRFLAEVEKKSNEKAKEDTAEKRTKQYFSTKYFASTLIFSIVHPGNSEGATKGKEAYAKLKDTEEGNAVIEEVLKSELRVKKTIEKATKDRQEEAKEESKKKPKTSTKKTKTREQKKKENLERDD